MAFHSNILDRLGDCFLIMSRMRISGPVQTGGSACYLHGKPPVCFEEGCLGILMATTEGDSCPAALRLWGEGCRASLYK
jgi:hypothetical protein